MRRDDIKLTLGANDARRRRDALRRFVDDYDVIGRSLTPSISQLLCLIADALHYEYEAAAELLAEVMDLGFIDPMADGEKANAGKG